ncbi:hypothetical protein GCM10009582_35040 [Arthrobacter flavus]
MIAMLAVSGCGAAANEASPSETKTTAVSSPTEAEGVSGKPTVHTFSSPDSAGPAGALTGQLVEVDGCLLVVTRADELVLPIFREESNPEWRNEQLTFDGTTFPAGAMLTLGGGELPSTDIDRQESCGDVTSWHTFMVLED